jgi:hypothetical protein
MLFASLSSLVAALPTLQVSPNGRSLVTPTGIPVFLLGDSAWAISKLSNQEVDKYLDDRVKKGFNCIIVS